METALGIIVSKDAEDYLYVVPKTATYAAKLKSQGIKERIIYNQAMHISHVRELMEQNHWCNSDKSC